MENNPIHSPYYHFLLENEDYLRWYNNLSRGSQAYADECFRRVGLMCIQNNTTPTDLAKLDSKSAANFIMDMIGKLETNKKSACYIANCVKAVKNWMQYCGIEIKQRIRLPDKILVTVADEIPPTVEELRRLLDACDLRARVACSLMAFCGFRVEVLGSYDGSDGLKVRDISEMVIDSENERVAFGVVPAKVTVRRNLSKTRNQYFTFLCEESSEYLRIYLESRMQNGEKITADSPIITPKHSPYIGKHVATNNVSDLMRRGIRDAGFSWRPYVLRRYFDTRMMVAEADGMIIEAYRAFWMGHSGNIEATYTVNKALSEDVVQKMRDAYATAVDAHLSTRTKRQIMTAEEVMATVNRAALVSFGYSEEELASLGDLAKLEPAQIQEHIKKKSFGLNGNRQKVIPLSDVRLFIEQGWEYVRDLPLSKEVIVSLPRS